MNINIGGSDFDEDDELEEAYESFGETPIINIYVEGFDDKRFWGKLFSEQGFSDFNIDAVGVEAKANGKGTILKLLKEKKVRLGKYYLVCMDSDYDNYYGLNQDILNNEFCFQTYAYSIENYYYHPKDFINLCCNIAGSYSNSHIPCFERLIYDWSKEYYPSFVKLLESGSREEAKKLILKAKHSGVELAPEVDISDVDLSKFDAIGLTPENLFLFYRGHNFEAQMKRLANRAIISLNQPAIQKISENQPSDKKESLIAECRKNVLDLETAVALRSIPDAICFPRIVSDIEAYKQKYA
ncbi:DUF4435 domain-containing protein [Vibrio parahaemolyticus]|uniref:DUF4435 domain-containing protein n=1 Tax=Vibrio parahaemolyticus TaxID=670 RepID=UPI001123F5D3|nr:DUF4435 domain-containing protein [Vibrio parahaemolyticus]EGQ9249123.1 DUF4435 domain-containing protein [Vibrio parahaemolyticus]EJG1192822.1 DUF4435 domain-containing protein [Vibrio parahaemolyticus]EJU9841203.1 DUF4435 domain-containing protein [Vibrio parahaemolyticus]TOE80335.1 hypothetical protein CGJ34_24475 [Vibrio parahaemolyticus]